MITDRKALRAQMIRLRESMSPAAWQGASAQLSSNLAAYLLERGLPKLGQVVAFCWPVQNEPDIRPLMECWRSQGVTVALPVVVAPGQALTFRPWLETMPLVPDRYGIPTPASGLPVTPDILLLPGNAFDADGYRLGYGGGFFDRTLAQMTPRPLVIGLCFEASLVVDLQPEAHDQPVEVVITESGVSKKHIAKR